MGIPIRVEDDDCVGRLQIQPKSARSRREHKDENVRAGRVVLFQQSSSLVRFGRAVQTKVFPF